MGRHASALIGCLLALLSPGSAWGAAPLDPTSPAAVEAEDGINAYQVAIEEAANGSRAPSSPGSGGQIAGAAQSPDCGDDRYCWAEQICLGNEQAIAEHAALAPEGVVPGVILCPKGEPEAPPVTPGMVRRAFERVPLPMPRLGSSPPGGKTLVNLRTIFYTEAEPFQRSVRLLGRTVRLEVAPVSFLWSVGQGGSFSTDWAGQPYMRGIEPAEYPDEYVTWVYERANVTERARVSVVWGATYSVDGGPAQPVPGTVTTTSPAISIRVAEARGVLTGAR